MSGDGDLSLQIEKVFIIFTFQQLWIHPRKFLIPPSMHLSDFLSSIFPHLTQTDPYLFRKAEFCCRNYLESGYEDVFCNATKFPIEHQEQARIFADFF